MKAQRISVTDNAKKIIDQLREKHSDLMFHQSGGCCDGSTPMCFAKGEFLLGSRDVCLGTIHGCIDVSPGRGASFSLEIPLGVRFMAVSRLLTEDERNNLQPIAQ